jgi:hypothetical protein
VPCATPPAMHDDTGGNTIGLAFAAALAFLWLIVAIPHAVSFRRRDGLPVEPKSAYSFPWRDARSKSGETGSALRSNKR